MGVFAAVIPLVFFSLAMAQQPLGNNLDRWWFLVTPMRNSPPLSSDPGLFSSHTPIRRDDYTYTTGIGSHKFHTLAATWNEARRTCEQESGHLAIINSIAEANVITERFKNGGPTVRGTDGDYAYIGFHDFFQEGEFVTINGQSLASAGFTRWASGQPSNSSKENCGCVGKIDNTLYDCICDAKLAFICELPVY